MYKKTCKFMCIYLSNKKKIQQFTAEHRLYCYRFKVVFLNLCRLLPVMFASYVDTQYSDF